MDLTNKDRSEILRIDNSNVTPPPPPEKRCKKCGLTKREFIEEVSKIHNTSEDEFKAQYNSPELLWENFLKKYFG